VSVRADALFKRRLLVLAVMLATIMQALDGTITNVALPYMQGSLSASQDEINWVLTSYIVSAAIMTTPIGWLTSQFGRTRVFIICVTGFTLVSICCGLSESIAQIVSFRVLQGMFGAALIPLSQAVLIDAFPAEERGAAMALWGIGVMVGPIMGPTVGGWITAYYSWRWVFYINVPIGILTVIGILASLQETPRTRTRFDWPGFLLFSLAIGSFQLMLDRGQQQDWFSAPEIIIEACVAGTAFYCFIVHFSLAQNVLVPPRLFRDMNYSIGIFFTFLTSANIYATLALLSPYLETLRGYPAATAGLLLAPRGAGTMLAMYVTGKLTGKVDNRLLVIFGFACTIYAMIEMMDFTLVSSNEALVTAGFIQGLGAGFIIVALSVSTFATLPPDLRTQGTSVFALLRNLGSSIGISVTGSLLVRNTEINHASIAAAITPFNHNLAQGAAAVIWNPLTRGGASALDLEINRQAASIAYIDDFKLMLLVSVAALPFLAFLRRPGLVLPLTQASEAAD
jgi:DHA2 family multidrug resistance protein